MVQLDRASASEAEDYRFESCRERLKTVFSHPKTVFRTCLSLLPATPPKSSFLPLNPFRPSTKQSTILVQDCLLKLCQSSTLYRSTAKYCWFQAIRLVVMFYERPSNCIKFFLLCQYHYAATQASPCQLSTSNTGK